MELHKSKIRKHLIWLAPLRGLIRPLEAIAAIIWMQRTLRKTYDSNTNTRKDTHSKESL